MQWKGRANNPKTTTASTITLTHRRHLHSLLQLVELLLTVHHHPRLLVVPLSVDRVPDLDSVLVPDLVAPAVAVAAIVA